MPITERIGERLRSSARRSSSGDPCCGCFGVELCTASRWTLLPGLSPGENTGETLSNLLACVTAALYLLRIELSCEFIWAIESCINSCPSRRDGERLPMPSECPSPLSASPAPSARSGPVCSDAIASHRRRRCRRRCCCCWTARQPDSQTARCSQAVRGRAAGDGGKGEACNLTSFVQSCQSYRRS